MAALSHSVEVNAPLNEVYNQWTRFEDFPRFMEGIEEVRRDGPNRLFWKAKIAGKEKQWEAEITEQVPDTKITWRSVDGAANMGTVTFEKLDALQTRITLRIEYEPEGFIEQAGDALGIPLGQVAEDLNRFREFMESGRRPLVSIGQTDPLEGSLSNEPATKAADTWSAEESAEREALSRAREIPQAAVTSEAIMPDRKMSGIGPSTGDVDSHPRHGTVIADTPRPMANEGSSVEENIETDRGDGRSRGPTYEEIARRAYELYLERGERPGDEREDWLRAESELSQKSRDDQSI
jgi:uncharacterized protein YndB with AHSA1/START domain